jgi:hypothetical protein
MVPLFVYKARSAKGCWCKDETDQQLFDRSGSERHEHHYHKSDGVLGEKWQLWIRRRRYKMIQNLNL